jgi:phosphomannomutase
LFRQSGTEPMLRIYSEATSVARANALLDAAEQLACRPAPSFRPR